ncbi:hypothetical protein ACX31A_11975 [Dermacoccus nishinomiyaensis]
MAQLINDYAPKQICDAETWALVAPNVRAAVLTQGLTNRDTTFHWMAYTTRYFAWCARQGHPLEITQELVDAFCDSLNLAASTVQSHRTRLRRMGEAQGTIAPRSRTRYTQKTSSGQAPYTPDELERWWQIASAQKTVHRTRLLQAVVAFGAGAGLTTTELGNLRANDVRPHPEHPELWLVHLPDRVVPIDHAWLSRCQQVLTGSYNGYLFGSPHSQGKDLLTVVKSKAAIPTDAPDLTVRRLRTTYAVTMLNRHLSATEFMAIFGSTSAITFERLARFVDARWDDAEYLRIAAGIA